MDQQKTVSNPKPKQKPSKKPKPKGKVNARYQVKVKRKDKSPAWLVKTKEQTCVVLEAWFATKFSLKEAKQIIEELQPTLPKSTQFEVCSAIFTPPRQKRSRKEVRSKNKDKINIGPKLTSKQKKKVKKSLLNKRPVIEVRNPFPEGKIDFNTERTQVNDPTDCFNCGICRTCLDKERPPIQFIR